MGSHLKNFYGGNYITSLVNGFRRRAVKRWKADYVLYSILSSDLTTVVTGLTQNVHASALGSFCWQEMTDDRY